jgi:hypothetical protein
VKPLPGYKRMQQRISFDEWWLLKYKDGAREMIARATGDMLATALLTEGVDTTKPIFIDGAQRVGSETFFFDGLTEVKLELHFVPRPPDHPKLEHPRRALDG